VKSEFSFLAEILRQQSHQLFNDFDLKEYSRAVWAIKPGAAIQEANKYGAEVDLTNCRKLFLALGGLRGNTIGESDQKLVKDASAEILKLSEWFDAKANEGPARSQGGIKAKRVESIPEPDPIEIVKAEIREVLKGNSLALWNRMIEKKHFVQFDTIESWEDCFRSNPASGDAINKAFKRLKDAVMRFQVEVEVSLKDRRAKVYFQTAK